MTRFAAILLLLLPGVVPGFGRERYAEYALVLDGPSVAAQAPRGQLHAAAARARYAELGAAQQTLRRELERRHIKITGAAQTLVNAVFVRVTPEQAAQLRSLPGVARAQYLPPLRRNLDRALDLVKARDAWNAVGGMNSAGAGIKIAILDTGIDQNHAAFRDPSLQPPAGFPKGDTNYTNGKVVVARSYVSQLSDTDPKYSTPDDTSPRDRVGHGTAVAMIAAGATATGPAATITGVAPKAWLGNYKIFGSPGVNDVTFASVIVQALEDALNDGMDLAVLSVGNPALYGPLDQDPSCGSGGAPADCDVRAQAVEQAVKQGLTVVVSAGNDGNVGAQFPTLNSIHTPGTAPSAITVGATTNAHMWFSTLSVTGSGVPSDLRSVNAIFGDGPKPPGPLTAPLRDVSQLQDNGRACSPLTNNTLTGAIALVQRGDCSFTVKVNNAQKAGAVAVVIYQVDGSEFLFRMVGMGDTGIPAVMIGNRAGTSLKQFLAQNPDRPVTLDPAIHAVDAESNTVAEFSSRGPNIGANDIKPEVVAPGTDLYTATQKYDPNGDMYDATGYTSTPANGTSFAAPMVAGAAAMVKQKNPGFGPAQIKSAVVNTATTDITDNGGRARVTAVGAGKLNAAAAVAVTATVEPATLGFGGISTGTLPVNKTLRITNTGASAVNYSLSVEARDADNNARITLNPASININPGQQGSVSVSLGGSTPAAGTYEGFVTISGGGTTLRVPYLYMASDGQAANIFPVINGFFTGVVNDANWLIGFKVVDRFGLPVVNAPVRFRVVSGGGSITQADAATDKLGIAAGNVNLGPLLGDQIFTGEAGGLTVEFDAVAKQLPAIANNGVVNAASFQVGQGLAPGSYISILGAGFSDATRAASTPYLPLSLTNVSVSFDSTDGRLSLPGRLHFVSPGQINVQVPWEFQGQTRVLMKVNAGNDIYSSVYTVPLNDYSPGVFEFDDAASGRRLGAILDANFRVVTPANPAQRGQPIQIYANGLGPVDNQPASGEFSPAEPLARTRVTPVVTIGGKQCQVLFSGLAPGIVGLYQVNVIVPADAPSGIQPLVITANGIDSKASAVPVQ